MAEEPSMGITAVIILIIAIIIIAAGYQSAHRKVMLDSRTIVKNDASSIYSILLEISSAEQGYAIYDRITRDYNISLDKSYLVVKAITPMGLISYKISHKLDNVIPSKVNGTEAVCVVKKIVNCKPQIMICDWRNKTCCNIGETIC